MSVSLKKGQKVSLTKEKEGLKKVIVGLGWDAAKEKRGLFSFAKKPVQNIDCDASAILLRNGRLTKSKDVVYFNNLRHSSKSVIHMGDNLTGDGDGDDEQIVINLMDVPEDFDKIAIVVNIYQASERGQHFGMIENAYIRIVDASTNEEICKYNLSEDCTNMTSLIFGEVYRDNGEWKFDAIGRATQDDGLTPLTRRFMKEL